MNFYEALNKMNDSRTPCYMCLIDSFETINDEGKDDIGIDVYIVMFNPCWMAEVKFLQNNKEVSRIPTRILLSNDWEVMEA